MADLIRVLLVDDDPLVRMGLSMVLGAGPDIEVVGEAATGAEAVDQVAATRPDVVLMDIRMPGMDGLTALSEIRRRYPGGEPDRPRPAPAVLVLTTFDTDDHVVRALRLGASGFLVKDTAPGDILAAVRRVAAGARELSPSAVDHLIDRVARDTGSDALAARAARARQALDRLTPREREVALAVGDGYSNAEIGVRLFVSVATVKAYVSRILTKLDCANRVQVAILVHESRAE